MSLHLKANTLGMYFHEYRSIWAYMRGTFSNAIRTELDPAARLDTGSSTSSSKCCFRALLGRGTVLGPGRFETASICSDESTFMACAPPLLCQNHVALKTFFPLVGPPHRLVHLQNHRPGLAGAGGIRQEDLLACFDPEDSGVT